MGVPTSEGGYTSVMPRREDHEFHKGHVMAWGGTLFCLQRSANIFPATPPKKFLLGLLLTEMIVWFRDRTWNWWQRTRYSIICGVFNIAEFIQSYTNHIYKKKSKFRLATCKRVMVQRLFAGIPPQSVRFDFTRLHVRFVVEIVAFVQNLLIPLILPCFYSDNPEYQFNHSRRSVNSKIPQRLQTTHELNLRKYM